MQYEILINTLFDLILIFYFLIAMDAYLFFFFHFRLTFRTGNSQKIRYRLI